MQVFDICESFCFRNSFYLENIGSFCIGFLTLYEYCTSGAVFVSLHKHFARL